MEDALYCGSCGVRNASTNKFCTSCGTQIIALRAIQPVASVIAPPTPYEDAGPVRFNYLEALTFPFRNPNWPKKLWWIPLIFFVPGINVIVMRGWRLDITRRFGRGNPDRLPDPHDIGRFFAEGLLLWGMTAVYWVPQIILLSIFGSSMLETLLTIGSWLLETFTEGTNPVSFGVLIAEIGIGALVRVFLPIIYEIVAYPMYRLGMVRYALSGKVGAFFSFRSNLQLLRRHIILVLSIFFFDLITTAIFAALGGAVASTFIGALLIPLLLFPALYWTNGYFFGTLASVVQADLEAATA